MVQIAKRDISGLILAGGRGLRLGGLDKGLQPFNGRPLIEQVLARLAPQVGRLLISANRNGESYARYGHPVLPDIFPGYLGPLAGLHAGLTACLTPFLAAVPCDAPALPEDLVTRLAEAVTAADVPAAFAVTTERRHPVFLLLRRGVLAPLESQLANGRLKVEAWCREIGAVEVRFENERMFANLNVTADIVRPNAAMPP